MKNDDLSWLVEGNIVAAMVCYSNTVHAGVVHPVPEMRAYSMSPLCVRYRKANGDSPAVYQRGATPHLDRKLDRSFGDYRSGVGPAHGRKVCRWCVAVWDADAELEASVTSVPDDLSRLSVP